MKLVKQSLPVTVPSHLTKQSLPATVQSHLSSKVYRQLSHPTCQARSTGNCPVPPMQGAAQPAALLFNKWPSRVSSTPSLISLVVSVDVKQHVYLLCTVHVGHATSSHSQTPSDPVTTGPSTLPCLSPWPSRVVPAKTGQLKCLHMNTTCHFRNTKPELKKKKHSFI